MTHSGSHFYKMGVALAAFLLLTTPWAGRASSSPSYPSTFTGTTYYVAPDGNDANPGTEAQPWQTIQQAANTLQAGDTVYVKAGTYAEQVQPQHSGDEGRYITYAAYPGDEVIIDGTGIALPEYTGLFFVSGQTYIKISDCISSTRTEKESWWTVRAILSLKTTTPSTRPFRG